ncbi:unnamed protein product [Closterium sp. NIES-65]|nr:unnamed protein product [Closterium sp. NIES-65]
MPPKANKKTLADAPTDVPEGSDTLPSVDPASGKQNGKQVVSSPVKNLSPAGSSGLSVADKASSPKQQDDDFLDEESDDELDLDFSGDLLTRICYTGILPVPIFLQGEMGAVITSVRTLLKKVWAPTLSPGAAVGAKVQTLQPAFVAKTKYCRLQMSLLQEEDIEKVRQKTVEYQRQVWGGDAKPMVPPTPPPRPHPPCFPYLRLHPVTLSGLLLRIRALSPPPPPPPSQP